MAITMIDPFEIKTKDFKDSDWDAYRNNSIGFIFQKPLKRNSGKTLTNIK